MTIVDTAIQSNVTHVQGRSVVRDSQGVLYTIVEDASEGIVCFFSDDAGQTWDSVTTTDGSQIGDIQYAISSDDVVHLVYRAVNVLRYNTFSAGAFGTPETIHDGSATSDQINATSIAIDSEDTPHVVWVQDYPEGTSSNVGHLLYSKRVSGSWTAPTDLHDDTDAAIDRVAIAIDSNDYIHVAFVEANGVSVDSVSYVAYTTSWSVPIQLTATDSYDEPSIVVDSADNVWVFCMKTTGTNEVKYVKYTASTQLWGSATTITTSTEPSSIGGASIDASDNMYVAFFNSGTDDIYLLTYTGTWSAEAKIIDATAPNEYQAPILSSCLYPIVGGQHTNIPTTGYHMVYRNVFTDGLRYHASTALAFPASQSKNYTKGDLAALPTGDTPLENLFTTAEYTGVAADDDVYASQTATDQYSITKFRNRAANDTDEIHVSWRGKSSLAPATSPVVLQIYNRSAGAWETLVSNSDAPADTDFTLTASKTTNLNQYYDGNNWVAFRVYQLAS